MLAEYAAPWCQPVLDEVVVELEHNVEGLLDLEISEEEGEHLHDVEHDLNHDGQYHRKFALRFKLVTVVRLPLFSYNVLLKGEKDDGDAVNDSNDGKANETVHRRLLLLHHGLDLHDTLVVRDKGAEEQEANGAHEGRDFKDDDCPVLILRIERSGQNVALED